MDEEARRIGFRSKFEDFFWLAYPCAQNHDRRSSACKECIVRRKCRDKTLQARRLKKKSSKIWNKVGKETNEDR